MTIRYSKNALRFLSKLDENSVKRIRNAINGLVCIPQKGDVKLLKGYDDARKRLRVGAWRIIFKYVAEDKLEILYIIDIGNRGDIYK